MANQSPEWWSRYAASIGAKRKADPARLVRCLDCRHLRRNPHTPEAGFAECGAGLGFHFPRTATVCVKFEQEERQ